MEHAADYPGKPSFTSNGLKAVIATACCFVAVFGGSGPCFAQGAVHEPSNFFRGPVSETSALGLFLRHRQQLELSVQQVQRIEELQTALQKDAVRQGAVIQIAELELLELQQRPTEGAAVATKLREIEAARTALRLAGITAAEQARALLSPAQLATFQTLRQNSVPSSAVESVIDPAVVQQIQLALKEQLKDRQVVEVETTQAIINRLIDYGKLLLLFAGIPLTLLGFLGVKKFSNLAAVVKIAEKKVEDARKQVAATEEAAGRLAAEYQNAKQNADDLAARYQEIKENTDRALLEISKTTRLVLDEGEKATLEIRTTAAAFRAQPATVSDGEVITIPVVVHVVYRTEEENISDTQINSQIEVLNEDFRAKNPDISKVPEPFKEFIGDAQIEFVLATTDPLGKPTNGITRTKTKRTHFDALDDSSKSNVKTAVQAWDTERYLNIWVCTLSSGMLRYSQFPGGPKESDGVVVYHKAFGTTGTVMAPFDRGRTTTGGIGMFLNLRHIWGDTNDCRDSDFVADTPPQRGPNFGKPTFPKKGCPKAPHGDMFMNFMDYVDDDAMYMFTKGQALRMRETLQGPRRKLRV